jgi:hypothetical protein
VSSERCSIEEQSIEYFGMACCVLGFGWGVLFFVRGGVVKTPPPHVTRHNTPIHNILSTAPQLSISQKALGTPPEDGNVMPKHVRAAIHN